MTVNYTLVPIPCYSFLLCSQTSAAISRANLKLCPHCRHVTETPAPKQPKTGDCSHETHLSSPAEGDKQARWPQLGNCADPPLRGRTEVVALWCELGRLGDGRWSLSGRTFRRSCLDPLLRALADTMLKVTWLLHRVFCIREGVLNRMLSKLQRYDFRTKTSAVRQG